MTTHTSIVDQITDFYNDILCREPKQAGLDFWTTKVESGQLTIHQVQSFFENSNEAEEVAAQRDIIEGYYTSILGYPSADEAGVKFWLSNVREGKLTMEQVEHEFQEVAAKHEEPTDSNDDDHAADGADNNTIRGTNDADELWGTSKNDDIFGFDGDDVINGKAGCDWLVGGEGCDIFKFTKFSDSKASMGADFIGDFTPGADRIDISELGYEDLSAFKVTKQYNEGVEDMTTLYYDEHNDFGILFKGDITLTDEDVIFHGEDVDGMIGHGGPTDDIDVYAQPGDDFTPGTDGDNGIFGTDGDDSLFGYGGDDVIDTGRGNDYVATGAGRDIIMIDQFSDSSAAAGVDYVGDFTQGLDKIDVSALGFDSVSDFTYFRAETVDGSVYTEINNLETGFALGFNGDYTFTNTDFIF